LGGFESYHSDSLSRLVTIPATGHAKLSYYVRVVTKETAGSAAFDTMTVRAGSKVLQVLSNRNAGSVYQHMEVDVSLYAGKTIALSFSGAEDGSMSTSFALDDVSITAMTVPDPPTAVSAKAGNTQVVVSWAAPVNVGGSTLITGYKVTASPGGQTASTTGAARTATVTGLPNGTSSTFTVTATNVVGTSRASSASAAVTPRTVPGLPTNVVAAPGNAQASVSWTPPANNGGSAVTGYHVTAVPIGPTVTTTGAQTTVTGLVNGTSYTFTVTATNAAGDSLASLPSPAITPSTVPGVPTGVTAVAGNTEAMVSWTAPTDGGGSVITGYTVSSEPGGATVTTTGDTTATVAGLSNGTSYTFRVRATNVDGDSAASLASEPVTPTAPMTVPEAPVGVVAVAGTADAVVTWEAPPSDGGSPITGYSVTAAPEGVAPEGVTATVTMPGDRVATVTGLVAGTSYTFTVTATNVMGESLPSLPSAAMPFPG
jgi:hypothetical protein